MTVIHVPRLDPKTAMNPNRPANALLKAQILHLHDAELRLPVRRQTDIYINAIKTEGEAAEYIRQVTAAIHGTHLAAAAKRARPKRGIDIAAAADKPARKRKSAAKRKSRIKAKPKRKS
jgi:hypothetical protein